MIDCELYPAIYKRKSFHLYDFSRRTNRNRGSLQIFFLLCSDIKTAIRIVPADETTCRRGEEYCILLYSEKKEHYLQNIGYIGEQLDLYLTQKNIGTLWFGIGKTEEPEYENFNFIIMIAIAKVTEKLNCMFIGTGNRAKEVLCLPIRYHFTIRLIGGFFYVFLTYVCFMRRFYIERSCSMIRGLMREKRFSRCIACMVIWKNADAVLRL